MQKLIINSLQKRKYFLIALFFLAHSFLFAQVKKPEDQKMVADFIDCIRHKKMNKLLNRISFPFRRQYPIPSIKNEKEFSERFKEIFDDHIIQMIVHSNPSKDWSDMGWRGIMLFEGELWLDTDGKLIGVNYQSEVERKKREELIRIEKSNLFESLRKFENPVCIMETTSFRIRIDDLGNYNYRYAVWPLKSSMKDKPDMIIENGKLTFLDSGGDHTYSFKNGDYIYECEMVEIGEEGSPPAYLKIYKDSKIILKQRAGLMD